MIGFSPILDRTGWPGAELTLVTGAFLVGYLKRYGILGAGIGSQIYIGQLLAYGARPETRVPATVAVAGVVACAGPCGNPATRAERTGEHPVLAQPLDSIIAANGGASRELRMGLQAAIAALAIVLLNHLVRLEESAWAITACTYVIAGTTFGTIDRVRRRIIGTVIGVPLGLGCLPIALHAPIVAWALAALAMIIYAMALPERYDIACGAYAFTLILTLAVSGESSAFVLASREHGKR